MARSAGYGLAVGAPAVGARRAAPARVVVAKLDRSKGSCKGNKAASAPVALPRGVVPPTCVPSAAFF